MRVEATSLFQLMRFLIPALAGHIPRWRNLVASIQFAVSKGVEVDVVEGANLVCVFITVSSDKSR